MFIKRKWRKEKSFGCGYNLGWFEHCGSTREIKAGENDDRLGECFHYAWNGARGRWCRGCASDGSTSAHASETRILTASFSNRDVSPRSWTLVRSPEFGAERRMVGICARSETVKAPGMTSREPLFKKSQKQNALAQTSVNPPFKGSISPCCSPLSLHKQRPSLYLWVGDVCYLLFCYLRAKKSHQIWLSLSAGGGWTPACDNVSDDTQSGS